MSTSDMDTDSTIDRRTILRAVGGASAVGLAGCTGNGGNGNGGNGGNGGSTPDATDESELGERVESLQIEYWSDYGGFTTTQEQMAPVIRRGIEENLGVSVEIVPVDISTQLGQLAADENRDADVTFGWWVPTADRIDPQELLSNLRIDFAGANGRSNYWNWADCDYTELVLEQETAPTPEDREELIHEAVSYMSEACVSANLCPVANIGAWRTDMVEMDGIGDAGIARSNADWVYKSTFTGDGNELIVGTDPIATETTNFPTHHASMPEAQWQHMIHSPVHKYDANYEIEELLGSVDVIGAQEVVVELFDDAEFSNGDPVTAQDVKFTFEQVTRGADAGAYPGALPIPFDEIVTEDEKTVRFTFTEPYIPFANSSLMRWGIWHRDSFVEAGARENPADVQFDLPIPTSGPLGVADMEPGSRVICEPNEGHAVYNPDQTVIFEAYRNEESMVQALQAGEAHIAPELSPPNAQRVNDTIDNAEAEFRGSHTTYLLQNVSHIAPNKFEEFRKATSAAINRQEMIQIAFNDQVEPELYPAYISATHPMYPPEEDMYQQATPTGEPERAQQLLEDAGWGWDGDGNLHYPPDADLEPLWPQGEVPSAEDFPCIDELNLDP